MPPFIPNITNFSIPEKTFGGSSFNITDPSSNSDGAFSYTSSNTNVADISGTPIKTDQGIIAIEKINPDIHTIRNKTIIGITQSIYASDKYLICFEKDCLGNNIPYNKTIMSMNHKVFL